MLLKDPKLWTLSKTRIIEVCLFFFPSAFPIVLTFFFFLLLYTKYIYIIYTLLQPSWLSLENFVNQIVKIMLRGKNNDIPLPLSQSVLEVSRVHAWFGE